MEKYVKIVQCKKKYSILVEGRLKSYFDQATNTHNQFRSWLFFSPPRKVAIGRQSLANQTRGTAHVFSTAYN